MAERVRATIFVASVLSISIALHQTIGFDNTASPLQVAKAAIGIERAEPRNPNPSLLEPYTPAQSSGMTVGATSPSRSAPERELVYDSRGPWLREPNRGILARVDRGPVPRQSALVPILMYHHVRPIDFKTSNAFVSELTLPPSEFEQELGYLQGRGFRTATLEELYLYLQGRLDLPPRTVVLTFDDGYLDNYQYALPLMLRYGAKGTFFIITGLVEKPEYMTWSDVKALVSAGMEIGSHTVNHPDLAKIAPPQRERELAESRRVLEDKLGVSVRMLSYPSGSYNADTKTAAEKAGYVTAVTTRYGAMHDRDKLMELSRVRISGHDTLPSFRWKIEQYFPNSGTKTK